MAVFLGGFARRTPITARPCSCPCWVRCWSFSDFLAMASMCRSSRTRGVSASVVLNHQRVVAHFDWGLRMRAATVATTKSR